MQKYHNCFLGNLSLISSTYLFLLVFINLHSFVYLTESLTLRYILSLERIMYFHGDMAKCNQQWALSQMNLGSPGASMLLTIQPTSSHLSISKLLSSLSTVETMISSSERIYLKIKPQNACENL